MNFISCQDTRLHLATAMKTKWDFNDKCYIFPCSFVLKDLIPVLILTWNYCKCTQVNMVNTDLHWYKRI